jgi:hypothetical protein
VAIATQTVESGREVGMGWFLGAQQFLRAG